MQNLQRNALLNAVGQLPAALLTCAQAFAQAGFPLYAVGGWVRDALLGLPCHDVDLASPAPWETAEALFTACGFAVTARETRLGTLGVRGGGSEYEYTAFRRESYGTGGVHRPNEVSFGASLTQDALRRDFTVNALYCKLPEGDLADPLGGLSDLQARRLFTCRAPQETFADDGLRLLRMVRFAFSLGMTVPEALIRSAQANAALLDDLSPERFRGELTRILLCQDTVGALEMMDNCGLLIRLIPELEACRDVAQRQPYHDYDVLHHLFHACACAPADEIDRWAALLHDIGKPASLSLQGNMHAHAVLGGGMARAILSRLKYPNAFADEVRRIIEAHMYDLDGNTSTHKLRWFFARLGRQTVPRVITLRRADVWGSKEIPGAQDPAESWEALFLQMLTDGTPFTPGELAVNGQQVMAACALKPGPRVGEIMERLQRYAVMRPEANHPDALLSRARRLCSELGYGRCL
ncbi:MAG: HD domain-containing protein [Eubacteriales bacterium]|nr:HD domain-containing protein [Eubacteriales bacterium]